MYGSGAPPGGGGGGGPSALSSAAPDFAPASAHSRAIRIVNPDDPNTGSSSTPTSPARRTTPAAAGGNAGSGAPPSRWSRASAIPSFQPRDGNQHPAQDGPAHLGPPPGLTGSAALSARNVAAPVFVPKQRASGSTAPPGLSSQGPNSASSAASAQQLQLQLQQPNSAAGTYDYHLPPAQQQQQQPSGGYAAAAMMSSGMSQNPYSSALPSPSLNPYAMGPPGMSPVAGPAPSLVGAGPPGLMPGGTLAMQHALAAAAAAAASYQPPLYHLYAPALPHISNLSPHHFALHAFFMSPALREELQRKNEAIRAAPLLGAEHAAQQAQGGPAQQGPQHPHQHQQLQQQHHHQQQDGSGGSIGAGARGGSTAAGKALPEELHVYHSLIPLEPLGAAGAALSEVHPALAPGSASFTSDASSRSGGGPGGSSGPGGNGGGSGGGPSGPGSVGVSSASSAGLGITSSTTMSGEPSKVFGYRTHVYRAICRLDGKAYALRRLEGFRLQYEAAIALVERWRRVRHPGVVCVREAFTTRAFGDSSIVFVSDYHPLASNLLQEYLQPRPPRIDPRTNRLQPVNMQIPERTLWSYLVQIASALRAVHRAGLAVRCLEASKVLLTGKNRIRIGGCSIFDVLQYDPQQPAPGSIAATHRLRHQQAEDLYALGLLALQLGTNSLTAAMNAQAVQRSLEHIGRTYSADVRELCVWLLEARPGGGEEEAAEEDGLRTVVQLDAILAGFASPSAGAGGSGPADGVEGPGAGAGGGAWRRGGSRGLFPAQDGALSKAVVGTEKALPNRCADELDAALNWGDLLEGELMKETENARLVRLVCKLGLINERPEFDHDPRWSETGDRYIIKLFRDYVFHAVDPETGQPVVDLSYILTNLNKLDAGSGEKIVLTSRDEQSCLVVSYRDIKNCIENAFKDLARAR